MEKAEITELKKGLKESDLHFVHKVYKYIDDTGNINNARAGEICRSELGENKDESAYRKVYQDFSRMWDSVKGDYIQNGDLLKRLQEIDDREDELYKAKVKYADKIREYRQLLRDDARIENINDVFSKSIDNLEMIEPTTIKFREFGDLSGILMISDFHLGKIIDNYFNKFNKEIAKRRVDKLIKDTLSYCNTMGVSTLYVLNLNDMIEGNLRVTARVQQEEDVVQQIITASELVSYLLISLSDSGLNIKYGSVLDNHSRINTNWREHIEKESYVKLIDYYISLRVGDKVEIITNNIDDNIGKINVDGKLIYYVHGHLKAHNVNTILMNLTAVNGVKPDLVLMGHYHTALSKESHFSKIMINGSLSGVDDYAFNSGFYSKPSQTLIVLNNENDIRIDINLDNIE